MTARIIVLLISLFISWSANAVDAAVEELGDGFKVALHEKDWRHISVGEETATWVSGNHDLAAHWEKTRKDRVSSVYFDLQNKIYIISSKKGDSLPDIIDTLLSHKIPDYHTLFPPGVLTKRFVLNAFRKAYAQGNFDKAQRKFQTEIDGILVTGFFVLSQQTFQIKTLYPDIHASYAREFSQGRDRLLPVARFLRWDFYNQLWMHDGNSPQSDWSLRARDLFDRGYIPGTIYSYYRRNMQTVQSTPQNLKLALRVRDHVVENKVFKEISVFDLFFANRKKPTNNEEHVFAGFLQLCGAENFVLAGQKMRVDFRQLESAVPNLEELGVCLIKKAFMIAQSNLSKLNLPIHTNKKLLKSTSVVVVKKFERTLIGNGPLANEFRSSALQFGIASLGFVMNERAVEIGLRYGELVNHYCEVSDEDSRPLAQKVMAKKKLLESYKENNSNVISSVNELGALKDVDTQLVEEERVLDQRLEVLKEHQRLLDQERKSLPPLPTEDTVLNAADLLAIKQAHDDHKEKMERFIVYSQETSELMRRYNESLARSSNFAMQTEHELIEHAERIKSISSKAAEEKSLLVEIVTKPMTQGEQPRSYAFVFLMRPVPKDGASVKFAPFTQEHKKIFGLIPGQQNITNVSPIALPQNPVAQGQPALSNGDDEEKEKEKEETR